MPQPVRFALPILAGVALALVNHPVPQMVGVLLVVGTLAAPVVGTLAAPVVGLARREWEEGRPPAEVRAARPPAEPGPE